MHTELEDMQISPCIIIAAVALSVGSLFCALIIYKPHNDTPQLLAELISFAACIVLTVFLIRAARHREKAALIVILVALAICAYCNICCLRIPLCSICDGVTADDLGWMSYWISCEA